MIYFKELNQGELKELGHNWIAKFTQKSKSNNIKFSEMVDRRNINFHPKEFSISSQGRSKFLQISQISLPKFSQQYE